VTPRELKDAYLRGENITTLLRRQAGLDHNTAEIIEVAYDLQAGSYVAAMEAPDMVAHKVLYAAEIARVIADLTAPSSVLEAGVGEATTLSGVLAGLSGDVQAHGFDLSWSRIAVARDWLEGRAVTTANLVTGSLQAIPFRDSSIDVVYTSHSMEPNGGAEAEILAELVRVARQYVVLLEPAHEFATAEGRARMESLGYVRDICGAARSRGLDVIRHELFQHSANPLNPTALTVIRKEPSALPPPRDVLACPRYRSELVPVDGGLFSPEALVIYPVVGGIPCLREENGVFASRALEHTR